LYVTITVVLIFKDVPYHMYKYNSFHDVKGHHSDNRNARL